MLPMFKSHLYFCHLHDLDKQANVSAVKSLHLIHIENGVDDNYITTYEGSREVEILNFKVFRTDF